MKYFFGFLFVPFFVYPSLNKISINDINSHSGSIIVVNDKYYLFGEYRVNNDGKTRTPNNQKITLYSSTDLIHWSKENDPIDLTKDPNDFEVERPKILFDKNGSIYSLYFHVQPHRKFSQGVGLLGIATSKDITGPYRVIGYYQIATGKKASTTQYSYEVDDGWKRKADGFYHDSIKLGQEPRDFYAFDLYGDTYVVYSAEEGYSVQLAKIDLKNSFAINTFHRLLVGERHEAPIYFSGFNKHYFVFSDISGYRPSESKLYSFDIKNKKLNYISPFARGNQMDVKTTFQSQPAFVFKCINTGKLIYVADKWLYKDKLKYIWKSKYVWAEIKWDSNKIPYIDKTSFKKNNICE